MKKIGKFASPTNAPTQQSTVDAGGSTIDAVFAEAIQATQPTLVVDKFNMVKRKDIPGKANKATFPIERNFDLNWTNISGTGSDTGSIVDVTAGASMEFKELEPVLYTAGIFITDMVDLTVNKANFEMYANRAAVSKQKKIDQDTIKDAFLAVEGTASTYAAGGFTLDGSIDAGSTLTPTDLIDAKTKLESGDRIYHPDAVLLHPNQYNDLVTHQDFSPSSTTGIYKKAVFDNDGELKKLSGMEIIKTELVNTGSGSGTDASTAAEWAVDGNPVVVFNRDQSAALCTKEQAFKVYTDDDRKRHGKWKIFDIMYKADYLLPESMIFLRAAD